MKVGCVAVGSSRARLWRTGGVAENSGGASEFRNFPRSLSELSQAHHLTVKHV